MVVPVSAPVPGQVLEEAVGLAVDFFGGKDRAVGGGSVGRAPW